MTENGNLSNERKRWVETTYAKAKERGGEREDTDFRTSSADVGPLYTPEDVVQIDYNRDIGYPGEYPYTRGVQASMYRGRLWSIRQYAGYGTAGETNKRFRFLLKEGQPGLSVAFDLPTQLGYDSEDRKSTRLNSSHDQISYAVFCLKKKKINERVGRNTRDKEC